MLLNISIPLVSMNFACEVNTTNRSTALFNVESLDQKIPLIENLGATLNQFDTLDLTNNDLRKLDGFPFLPKIKTLYLSNNRIAYVI